MTEIDFETLVSIVTKEMDHTHSEILREDSFDLDEVLEQYKRNVIEAIRAVFDEAETRVEIEERFQVLQQDMLQLRSRIGDLTLRSGYRR
ncbi:hypothetical protein [Methanoculleus sp.]|uniref:hypothetical protein n=1 Tax=Methanoculleus sp. TaxID=90427 RepID=UPI0025DCACAA|nr:hypothetical protein [Methanoculleus sp.]